MGKDWKLTPLGEVLTERKETPSLESIELGEIRIISKIGFKEGQIELREDGKTKTKMILARPGDLVISGINAVKGAIAIYPEAKQDAIAATIHYSAYIINKERADIKFLWWFLRSTVFKEIVQEHIPGGIKTELKPKRFLKIPVPLPPLNEQRRIVARIEALAYYIEKSQKIRTETNHLTKVLLRRTFDDLLDANAYVFLPLDNILSDSLRNGLSIPASGIGATGVLFAKVGIVNGGTMNCLETKRVDLELPQDSPFWMRDGDLFVSRGNSLELVGSAAVYTGIPANCAFPDLLIRIRVERLAMEPQFLAYFFLTQRARSYIENVASGTSPSMKKISQPKLKEMLIPVPPLDEQRRIVAYLDGLQAKVSELRRLQAESQAELDALLPSILDRAFKGEL